jgi:hypothetical protein
MQFSVCADARPGCPSKGRLLYPTAVRDDSYQEEHRQTYVDIGPALPDQLGSDPLLRRSFHAAGQPALVQIGGRSRCPRVTAGDRSFPLVLAQIWHALLSSRWQGPCVRLCSGHGGLGIGSLDHEPSGCYRFRPADVVALARLITN